MLKKEKELIIQIKKVISYIFDSYTVFIIKFINYNVIGLGSCCFTIKLHPHISILTSPLYDRKGSQRKYYSHGICGILYLYSCITG